jgi:AraC-like DNA-binding protein
MPIAEKRHIVQMAAEDLTFAFQYQAGYFPEYLVFTFKIVQSIIYLIIQWKLISDFKKSNENIQIQTQILKVVKWLKTFTWIFTTILFGFLFLSFFFNKFSIENYNIFINLVQSVLLSVSFFTLSSYILINPAILDGLPFIKYILQDSIITNKKESRPFIIENFEIEIAQIENYMKDQQVFLDPNISLTQISASLSIPIKALSYIINNHFQVRFNDYINQNRIDHFSKMLNEDYLNNYTIDALIKKSGFSSKSTFHAAFKKIHNCTPSQYIANNKVNFVS